MAMSPHPGPSVLVGWRSGSVIDGVPLRIFSLGNADVEIHGDRAVPGRWVNYRWRLTGGLPRGHIDNQSAPANVPVR